MADREVAIIVGVGSGLSAALARLCAKEGMAVALAARNTDKLIGLVRETGAMAVACDASQPADVDRLFATVADTLGAPSLVVFNASRRVRGPITELDPAEVRESLMTTGYAGFLVGRAAARAMLPDGKAMGNGSILFTGASASVKGYPQSAPFAMGKFALRGLAQSMARELAPKNIHVAHVVIDGGIRQGGDDPRGPQRGVDGLLEPDALARAYLDLHRQHRSAWSWELELRPWVESF
ncbi:MULTISPECIES: SDR family NAD(P)-dependent oxidoreductase [Oceanibaculum]|uniref:NADP-dependent 3-hydroxy acid dehydrogenase YdfG n=1 Tax=Oceanibaculum indicum TaxID=526216 RepID=A0A420WAD2_9PROT|nr:MULTISPECIES: SDR family NAD(P)-dependent oxidoreductase [Oceanibaculum]MCH2396371.1 SDR family NAD(P)-dependent oxidoreductase [Oceanibaculum sp.]RKQ67971.1 NADP-dependent 3-hydroxy acid dehydrogenase YdfG [Oceanibaculum indicum]